MTASLTKSNNEGKPHRLSPSLSHTHHTLYHLPFLCHIFSLQTTACSPNRTDLPHLSETIWVSTISFSARASAQLLPQLYYFPLPDAIFMSF